MINYSTDTIIALIQNRLRQGLSLSIVRLGDGEARTLNGFKDMPALEMILKKLLGEVPSIHEIKQIQQNLIEAYTDADIIGIPAGSKLDKKDPYWHNAFGILHDNVGPEVLIEKEFVNMDFCYDMLTSGAYDKILQGVDTLNYVSCRNLDEAFKKRFDIFRVNSIQIPPEMKFAHQYHGPKHFPDQFNQVRLWMKATPLKGNLFLYGAGVAGKVYGTWAAKKYGAVALDIGSVFDAWAGLITRGPGRGVNKIDSTYKL